MKKLDVNKVELVQMVYSIGIKDGGNIIIRTGENYIFNFDKHPSAIRGKFLGFRKDDNGDIDKINIDTEEGYQSFYTKYLEDIQYSATKSSILNMPTSNDRLIESE